MKLNVCVICADLNPKDLGGAEVHIVEVIRLLAEKGHKMHVFVGNDDKAKVLFKSKNVTIHRVKYKKIPNLNSLFYEKAAIKAVLNSGIKFDLLHAKQVYPQALIARKLKEKLGIPMYVTVQNPLAYKEEMVLKGAWKFLLSKGLWALELQIKNALKSADICACVSKYSQTNAIKMGAKNTVLIPNGIDLTKFKFYDGKRQEFLISTTSTLIPRNGIDILVEAMPKVIVEFPNCRLKIAGEGPMEAQLKKRVKELKIAKNVEFLGTLEHSKIPDLVKKSHLFVRPSRFEGFGVSFVEAMALGTPVVTCPVGGIVDFVEDKETGLLVEPENSDQLSRSIIFAFKNPKKMSSIVKKARNLVEDRYDWTQIAEKVEKAYFKIAV
jgi:phosphatidylinositol alpha-1,6-mannosyltransferase